MPPFFKLFSAQLCPSLPSKPADGPLSEDTAIEIDDSLHHHLPFLLVKVVAPKASFLPLWEEGGIGVSYFAMLMMVAWVNAHVYRAPAYTAPPPYLSRRFEGSQPWLASVG